MAHERVSLRGRLAGGPAMSSSPMREAFVS